jgi:hypothetical protein
MKKRENLYELNLSEELADLRGKLPVTMSPEAFLERFRITRDALPKEVTVLERIDHGAYPLSHRHTVFVAPNGSDDAPGTSEAPLATLKKAAERMAGKGGGTIFLRGGRYECA